MPVVPDEPARLRQDATLPLPEVHGTELTRLALSAHLV